MPRTHSHLTKSEWVISGLLWKQREPTCASCSSSSCEILAHREGESEKIITFVYIWKPNKTEQWGQHGHLGAHTWLRHNRVNKSSTKVTTGQTKHQHTENSYRWQSFEINLDYASIHGPARSLKWSIFTTLELINLIIFSSVSTRGTKKWPFSESWFHSVRWTWFMEAEGDRCRGVSKLLQSSNAWVGSNGSMS